MLVIDANRLVGDIVSNNNDKVSAGGRLIRDFLENDNYVLVNSTDKMVDGPFTRIDPADESRKSCLDLIIMSKNLFKYVKEVTIDKDRKYTPFHVTGKRRIVYPDHFAIIVKMENIPRREAKVKQPP